MYDHLSQTINSYNEKVGLNENNSDRNADNGTTGRYSDNMSKNGFSLQ